MTIKNEDMASGNGALATVTHAEDESRRSLRRCRAEPCEARKRRLRAMDGPLLLSAVWTRHQGGCIAQVPSAHRFSL